MKHFQAIVCIAISLTFSTSCNRSSDNQLITNPEQRKAGYVEVTTFRITERTSVDDFLKIAQKMQIDFLMKQEGFVSRSLTLSKDSTFIDIVYWKDQLSHENAMKQAQVSLEVVPFMQQVDMNSVIMSVNKIVLQNSNE